MTNTGLPNEFSYKTRKVNVEIKNPSDPKTPIFKLDNVIAPNWWSDRAVTICASKYFAANETSIFSMVARVVNTITQWGDEQNYFDGFVERERFRQNLYDIIIKQKASFNSPVWFNVGVPENQPQVSACYILDVEDNMEDILEHTKRSGMIFKWGSGSGVNISKLRAKGELLSNKGIASGPISFMKMWDSCAGSVRSGGKTRRSAVLISMNDDHPDLLEFINCKSKEEEKAKALIANGVSFEDAYNTVAYQNANHSVAITDKFMEAVKNNDDWNFINRGNKEIVSTHSAKDILKEIAQKAWETGDPGLLFIDRINRDNPVPRLNKISSTNPCGEFCAVPNSSCNLASINVLKYYDNEFNWDLFSHDVAIMITAMDIMIDKAHFPTKEIKEVTQATRPLGLGITNLGALLVELRLPYNSLIARDWSQAVIKRLSLTAYQQSINLSKSLGSYATYNEEEAVHVFSNLFELKENNEEEIETLEELKKYGLRNSQLTLLAPTGCLTGDSLILTSNGLLPIEELKPNDEHQWSDLHCDVIQEKKIEKVTKFYINGEDSVVKVKSSKGHEITCTPKHKFRVIDVEGNYVWKEAKELTNKDLLTIRLGGHETLLKDKPYITINSPTKETNASAFVVDEHVAKILGYYMGDGYIKKTGGVHFVVCDKDKDLLKLFNSWAERTKTKITTEKKAGCFVAHNNSRSTYKWFIENKLAKDKGNNGEGAASAFIPKQILSSRSSVLANFLSGLFEADGTVSVRNGIPIIELTTVSEILSKQVMTALESLGIPVKRTLYIKTNGSKGNRPKYRIRIASLDGALIFSNKIGFVSKRKSTILTKALSSYVAIHGLFNSNNSSRHMNIKSQILINDLYDASIGLPNEIRQNIAARKTQGIFNLNWAQEIISLNPQLENSKLYSIIKKIFIEHENNIIFVPVSSIEEAGTQMTYDISVPENNTYIANSLVTHNTISFMMDAETTGCEPLFALQTTKYLAGGGTLELQSDCVHHFMKSIFENYSPNEFDYYYEQLSDDQKEVLLTANELTYKDHINMVAACQRHLNGAISKTINLPNEATIDNVLDAYIYAWKIGLKGITIYRDGCKAFQPMKDTKKSIAPQKDNYYEEEQEENKKSVFLASRRKLPETRHSMTHKFNVGGLEGYLQWSAYDTGEIGEIFIKTQKTGTTVNGLLDGFATSISLGLQHGIPLQIYLDKFIGSKFEPAGFTSSEDVRIATSILDYIFRYLQKYFTKETEIGVKESIIPEANKARISIKFDGPPCGICQTLTTKVGTCYLCPSCGSSSGCS